MIAAATPPYVWTEERFRRLHRIHCPQGLDKVRFAGLCPSCGLPTMRAKPAKTMRTWSAHCQSCGGQWFVPLPRQLYAPTELLRMTGEHGTGAIGNFVESLQVLGARQEGRHRWENVQFGSKTRHQFAAPQACLACGEPASVHARRDKHGLPFTVCSACRARCFLRSEYALRSCLGWTAWFAARDNGAIWEQAYELGKARWSRWLAATPEQGAGENARTKLTEQTA